MPKLGLGTVQIGIPYGNRAQSQLMSESSAFELLHAAAKNGIRVFDTASAYGESESRIGSSDIIKTFPDSEVITKIAPLPSYLVGESEALSSWMIQQVSESLARLKMSSASLILFHDSSLEFIQNKNVQAAAHHLLQSGLVSKLGFSVYTPEQAIAAVNTGICSALQVPVNLVDRRFLDPTLLELFQGHNLRLIVRSIFLQGILNENAEVPNVKKSFELSELRRLLQEVFLPLRLQEAAIQFIRSMCHTKFDTVLIGAQSTQELLETLALFNTDAFDLKQYDTGKLDSVLKYCETHHLYDPSTWNS